MKSAFAYLRVSGKSQLDGHGMDRQEDMIRRYARKAGYKIAGVYKEMAVSGTLGEEDRPAFQEMVTDMLRNGVRVVIVEGLDRLAREFRIQEALLVYLASKGIELVSARTEENVTEAFQADPMRKALVQIQGVFAELEKELLVKKLRKAREKVRKEKGKCEGAKGYLEVAPELVEEIRRLRRKPRGSGKRMSFQAIADHLNAQGKRSRRGLPFTRQSVASIHKRCRVRPSA